MFESIGLLIGWSFCTYIVANVILGIMDGLRDLHKEASNTLVKRLDEIVHRVEVEQKDDIEYWYDMDNRKFLAQGRTEKEIINTLKSRFPNHIFYFENSKEILCAKNDWESRPVSIKVDVK